MNEIVASNPVGVSQFPVWFADNYAYLDHMLRSSEWTVPVFIAVLVLGGTLWVPGIRASVMAWYTSLGKYVTGIWKGWQMRKERVADQRTVLRDGIANMIEDEVEAGRMTELEANVHYKELARVYWELRNHVVKLTGKDKAREAIANTERDADGFPKPIPFPKEA